MRKILRRLGITISMLVGIALIFFGVVWLVFGVAWLVSAHRASKVYEVAATPIVLPADEAGIREGGRLGAESRLLNFAPSPQGLRRNKWIG